ncbi:hypothetical protein Ae201684P_019413 [Aphanomyces euteiches]|uniref:FYVE-type domain-containing protein n=1 Tax=Aphanomyces euteiches TaxID=100861 RepID=A0A6G0XE54_9STRA|nr:hypothetical protein Ae201684_005694 [Aphanomyces euteiches]KAH9078322.1 hypothetical protein Ae201684P_019413 [Aphanomyces euteiches]
MPSTIAIQEFDVANLCPPAWWVPTRRECHGCFKRFRLFQRRRNHCRMCGDVFCQTCVQWTTISVGDRIMTVPFCTTCMQPRRTASNRSQSSSKASPPRSVAIVFGTAHGAMLLRSEGSMLE